MPEIRIPPVLRAEAAGSRTVTVEATSVREALAALIAQYPSLEARVLPDGAVPAFLNLFVDGQDIRLLDGLDTPIGGESKVLLLPAVAGGAPTR
jgi:molybdopterin synthase sulfur carrier subunit